MATYEEVKDVTNKPGTYLIDVRNRDELEKTGVIPASLNIPISELEAGLKMPDEEFESTYNRKKPGKASPIIFSCLGGVRAQRATDLAKANGFDKPYKGSWKEWAEKEGL